MQLRSYDHMHFIQAVRDGEVAKLVNVSHGRPALVFKKVNDIYRFQDTRRIDPPSRLCSRKRFDTSHFGPSKVKVEFPNHPVRTDQQSPDCNSSGDTDEQDGDLDEFTFGNVTLKQIQERCRMKKRKRSTCVTVNAKNCAGSDEKESCLSSQLENDDNDLDQPLIKWKRKLKKNVKGGKKKSGRNHVTASSQNAIVVVKTEQTWFEHSFLQSNWDLPMPLAIKVEVPDYYLTGHEMTVCMPDGSLITDSEQVASYFLCAREEIQHADEGLSHIEVSSPESPVKELEDVQLNSNSDEADSTEDTLEIRNCTKDLQSTPSEEEYIVNDGLHLDADDRSSLSDGEAIPIHHSIPQHIELADAKLSLNFETSSTSHPTNDSTLNCHENPSLSCSVSSLSSADDSSAYKEKLSHVSAHVDVEETYFQKIPSYDAVPEQISSERIENNGSPDSQHVSRRLLSTRKVISPTSQEWLCKAMRSHELSDEGLHKCREKLYSRKQRNEKIPLVERKDQFRVGDLTGKLKKQRNGRTGSPTKGIQKMRQLSGAATSQISVECNSMRSSSESAIAFSQRQMQDIENLVVKLMTELKSVKEIAEEASHSGAYLSTQSKYDADEVRVRIESATRAEETAKRWLSMMARDCSRFCKIMRLTEDSRPVNETAAPKERKISFADEAGRKLCNVKYI